MRLPGWHRSPVRICPGVPAIDRRSRHRQGRHRVDRTRHLTEPTFGRQTMLLGLVGAALLAACEQQAETSAAPAASPPPAVTVISLQPTEFTPGFGFNGRVVAVDEVQLRARVTGFLEQRLFEEGADVAAGDLLFVIEKAPYQAVVEQRRAELASAEANRANTAVQLQRGEELVKNNNIPQAEVDQRRAADQMAAARDPRGAGGARAGRDQSRLHRDSRADRRPHRPRRSQCRQPGRPRFRRARDDREPGSDLRHLSGHSAPAPGASG